MEETNKNLVKDYKEKNANVFSLGMAINNAAVIATSKNFDRTEMKLLIKRLFNLYKEIRKEELGY